VRTVERKPQSLWVEKGSLVVVDIGGGTEN